MEYQNIIVEKKDGIAVITINRPKALNALNWDTLSELGAALDDIKADDAVRAAVITGSGDKAFVAGADISVMPAFTPVKALNFAVFGQGVLDKIGEIDKPVIAAVNGFALGGGLELALACDFIYASPNAQFGVPEITLGIIPGFGGTQRLVRQLGKGRALEMVLTGDRIDAKEAWRIGIANRVVEDGPVLDAAIATAKKMAAKGRVAVRMGKEAIMKGKDVDLRDGLFMERTAFAILCSTYDQKEGAKAFLEKRKAEFKDE